MQSIEENSYMSANDSNFSENKENKIINMQNNRDHDIHKTPSKGNAKSRSVRTPNQKSLNSRSRDSTPEKQPIRRSSRKITPSTKYSSMPYEIGSRRSTRRQATYAELTSDEDSESENVKNDKKATQLFEEEVDVEGKRIFCFNTPKKKDGMTIAAINTPKSQKTPKGRFSEAYNQATPESKKKRNLELEPKTPRHVRNKVKQELSKLMQEHSSSDFSADESEFSLDSSEDESSDDSQTEEEKNTTQKSRRPISVPEFSRVSTRRMCNKKTDEYVPESEEYFTSHSSSKAVTSDHTLDRLKNPRLPADRLFSLLSSMKLSPDHEKAISTMMIEYKSYFSKWMYILNEGYNILLYGLGSKRNLLQKFHREVLAEQTVLVVNGFFPSLTVKDILDSIATDILDITTVPASTHEAVDLIEEELSLIPETHVFLIVHNIDGAMLRNPKAQEIISRLSKIQNVHLLASIDHINIPLLWDHTKLSNFNFSWWDVTTMLPYSDETAFENSLLVQNSGELALSSMRNVFQSLTNNARGIYMLIVKYQLKSKGNQNYQGMPFKELYSACREAFLVSSDLALRAQLTEFLDHKLVKSRRSFDGTELLYIPIESGLLQQFVEQQE